MPAYNAEKYVAEAIECVITQSYSNWELIIADDGSTDGTRQIIDSYTDSRIRRFHQGENIGYLKTWNRLMHKADGRYITFLDADDLMTRDRIDILTRFMISNEKIGLCGSAVKIKNDLTKKEDEIVVFPKSKEEIIARFDNGLFPFITSSVILKKEVYLAIGGYRDFFDRIGWEDNDWVMRISENYMVTNISEALYIYRKHETAITNIIDTSDRGIRVLSIGEICREMARQRREVGVDCLMANDQAVLNNLIEKIELPFKEDPSYIYYRMSKRLQQQHRFSEAISLSAQGVLKNFKKSKNWKLFLSSCKHWIKQQTAF